MAAFRPPKEHLDFLAKELIAELKKNPAIELKKPEEAAAILRTVLAEDLAAEHALEEEALAMLREHGQAINSANANFSKMLQEGKKILAKKKGFTL
jgi:hypothetical protein